MSFMVFLDNGMTVIGEIIGDERFSLVANNSGIFMSYSGCCEI